MAMLLPPMASHPDIQELSCPLRTSPASGKQPEALRGPLGGDLGEDSAIEGQVVLEDIHPVFLTDRSLLPGSLVTQSSHTRNFPPGVTGLVWKVEK